MRIAFWLSVIFGTGSVVAAFQTMHPLNDFLTFDHLTKAGIGFADIVVAALTTWTMIFGIVKYRNVKVGTSWATSISNRQRHMWKVRGILLK